MIQPEDNYFDIVVADITHKCNMECANCYIPNRDIPDMDADKLDTFLSRLPNRTEIRLIGAEPTTRKDLPDLITMVRGHGHRPTLVTNGLKLGNLNYVKKLKAAGLRSVAISMNGADDDDVYEITDELRCATRKMAALLHCINENLFVNVNVVLQKGVNDHIPLRWEFLCKEYGIRPILRYKNVGQIGRHSLDRSETHSWRELVGLVSKATGVDESFILGHPAGDHDVLFPHKGSYIKITDWAPKGSQIPAPGSLRRGRITEEWTIAPFFEHVKENEFGY